MEEARDQSRFKIFTRRAMVLGGFKATLLTALLGRLYYLQVMKAEQYSNMADENRINLRLLPPPRGRIYDRNGEPIALNRKNYRVVVIPEQTSHTASKRSMALKQTLDKLGFILPISDRDRRRVMKQAKHNRSFVPITVKENLTWQQVSQIEVNSLDLPGVTIDVGLTRRYYNASVFAHSIGYVGKVSAAETNSSNDPLLELPDFRVGKGGVERKHELALRGKSGSSQVEVNAYGRIKRELSRVEGKRGADIFLTLDVVLQKYAMERIAAHRSAAAVVMDVHHGDVLAMASTPSFDPNHFVEGLSVAQWEKLRDNPHAPLTNKAVAGLYAPGSVFKMATALAALQKGIHPHAKIYCGGYMDVYDDRFHCWRRGGHGKLALRHALAQSCDVYFYDMALRVGIDYIAEVATKLGLGVSLGMDLPNEASGVVPTKEWKLEKLGRPWRVGESLIAAIGQGYVLSTPLQLCTMLSRLVNGGKAVVPHVASKRFHDDGRAYDLPEAESLGLDDKHLRYIKQGMDMVMSHPKGTAHAHRIEDEDYEMGGKTGTAQVRTISKAERRRRVLKNEELPWKYRDHALFAGYAPTDRPRYTVSVIVEHGGSGSKVAAPIARDLLMATMKRDPLRQRNPENVARAMPTADDIEEKL